MSFSYPNVARDETLQDEYFGIKVSDPYRWIEDEACEDTKNFVKEQLALTDKFITSKSGLKASIEEKLKDLYNFPLQGVPYKRNGKYFFLFRKPLQSQKALYMSTELGSSDAKVLVDPNEACLDGSLSIKSYSVSPDGKVISYGLGKQSAMTSDLLFKNTETGENYDEDTIKGFGGFAPVVWSHDNQGIFYAKMAMESGSDGTAIKHFVMFHKMGTSSDHDVLVAELPASKNFMMFYSLSPCGTYLILITAKHIYLNQTVYISSLKEGVENASTPKRMLGSDDFKYVFITSIGENFYFLTNKDAPMGQIVKCSLQESAEMETIVKEDKSKLLVFSTCVNHNYLVLVYLMDGWHKMEVRSLKTGEHLHDLDFGVGEVWEADYLSIDVVLRGGIDQSEFFFSVTSPVNPGQIFMVDMNDAKPTPKLIWESEKPFLEDDYKMEQMECQSKDGTKVPLLVCYKKDLKRDGQTPCLLYGYGGFDINLSRNFFPFRAFFLKHFGSLVFATLRGGGEFGTQWHEDGTRLQKQNCFDDFNAVAEFLVQSKITSSENLVTHGASNGGLLLGACVNQRPDLYAAAAPTIGNMDIMKFMRDPFGFVSELEYGNAKEDKAIFQAMLNYSPVHNIRKTKSGYPAVLAIAGEEDFGCPVSHCGKYIAQLQHSLGKEANQIHPFLLYVIEKTGHSMGFNLETEIDHLATVLTFYALSMKSEIKI